MASEPEDQDTNLWITVRIDSRIFWALVVLFILLLSLRLAHYIDWPWYVLTLPLWIIPAIVLLVYIVLTYLSVLTIVQQFTLKFFQDENTPK